MDVLPSFLALKRIRASLGDNPQGVQGQIALLLDKTLCEFERDFEVSQPKGSNIISLHAWKNNKPNQSLVGGAMVIPYSNSKAA
jgi:hypothetical protein